MFREWRGLGHNLSMLFVGLTLGLLLSLGWRSVTETRAATGPETSRIWRSVERLEAEQAQLKSRLAQLRQEVTARQQAATANTDQLQALRDELDRQQILAGLQPVQGPGVVVTLDDSAVQVRPGTDPNVYIVHETHLRDIVNLLWMAGSEAVAINDERLVGHSSVYCVGSTVLVNNTRLSPPYRIRAIGNARVQQDYLRNPSYLQSLKEKQQLYGLHFSVEAAASLSLPGYSGSYLVQHARPGE